MKYNNDLSTAAQQTATDSDPVGGAASHQNKANFVPSPDEVARRAYFAYENMGSQPGHDVQHWLKAEADLIAERNRTRVHSFHDKR